MAKPQRSDPLPDFRFLVEIDGIQQASFMECSGLGSHIEVVEYREGAEPGVVRKRPGRTMYPDIVLRWGVTQSRELYDWHLAGIQGKLQRKSGSVVLLDRDGAEKVWRNFSEALPSHWTGATLTAMSNDVAIESLTITCESQVQV